VLLFELKKYPLMHAEQLDVIPVQVKQLFVQITHSLIVEL